MTKLLPVRSQAGDVTALVDDEDFQSLSRHSWKLDRHGYAIRNTRIAGAGIGILMHRQILGLPIGVGQPQVDHRNGERLDNRRTNLRCCTVTENNWHNRPHAGSTSTFKGVTWHKGCGKWQASIRVNGSSRYLGIFASEVDAANAYDEAAGEAFGDYAYLNFRVGS